MFEIEVKSPTRVDLAGGTLDCWPLYLFLNEPVTVNVAIDVFTWVRLNERDGQKIEIVSRDLGLSKEYRNLDEALADQDERMALFQAHLRYWRPINGVYLETKSDSPVGGGLGGSSSLCISLLKAFSAWFGKKLDPYAMVRLASHIEAQVLLKPTGTQDYFPALFAGLNVIRYSVEGPQVEILPIDQNFFSDRFLLVYTGKSHHSGINNWDVIKKWLDGDQPTREALARLALVSKNMERAIRHRELKQIPSLFSDEYDARTALSDSFSSPEIKQLAEIAKQNGAVAKICGAGGGGCVLIWSPDQKVSQIAALCRQKGFAAMSARPWQEA